MDTRKAFKHVTAHAVLLSLYAKFIDGHLAVIEAVTVRFATNALNDWDL